MPEENQDHENPVTDGQPVGTHTANIERPAPKILPKLTWTKFQQLKLRHRREKWALTLLTPLIVLTALAALAYGSDFTFSNMSVAGTAVNLKSSDDQLRKELSSKVASYRFSLVTPNGKEASYKLSDAGISVNPKETVQDLRAQVRGLGWKRFAWWDKHTVNFVINKNDKIYNSFAEQNIAIANQPAVDATLTTIKGQAVITEGTNGWTYGLPGGNNQLATAARTLMPLKAKLAKTVVKPTVIAKNLAPSKAKLDAYLDHAVSFTLPDRTITAISTDIAGWLDIQPAPAHKTVDVTVNSGKISAWLDKATKSDIRPPRSQIVTTDAAGVSTVLVAGQNGMDITNKNAVVNSVATQLTKESKDIKSDLTVAYKSYSTINAADYPKWIVADVTTKRMYAFEHATLVKTFLISAGAPKTPTVLGTYQIFSKYTVKDMRGLNADGSRYFQPHVHYVNYFYRDYAIHGNYWRPSSYFGNINSSHGCVGITDSEAEWLYNWAPIGTTVITH